MTADNDVPVLLVHARQAVQQRNVTVGDLLPDARLHWAALLTHGYVHYGDGEREVSNFSELGIIPGSDAVQQFSQIRSSGELLEGEKRLPIELTSVLLEHAGGKVWIRNSELPVLHDLAGFEERMRAADPDFEFEACAGSEEWYMRFRDDDAAIFIAATPEVLDQLMTASPDCVLPIEANFLYAR